MEPETDSSTTGGQVEKEEMIIWSEDYSSLKEKKGWEELFHRLSHPFPLVMIDSVKEIERGKKIMAMKLLTADELYLSGHFPGEPIMPGVLTLEGMVQSALLLLGASFSRGKVSASLQKVTRVRFKRAIVPGDQVDFLVSLSNQEGGLWKFKGKAQVGEEVAAEADIVLEVTVREVGFDL